MARTINSVAFMMVVVAAATLLQSVASTLYHVGDNNGWQDNGFNYSNWATQHTFVVGDVLEFDFTTGLHTAAMVSQADYNNCNTANTLATQTNGPANYTLSSVGQSYFICTESNHCASGQKIAVYVTSSAGSPFSSPPGYIRTSPPPPPPNSATRTASAAAVALGFLSIAVAFCF